LRLSATVSVGPSEGIGVRVRLALVGMGSSPGLSTCSPATPRRITNADQDFIILCHLFAELGKQGMTR